MRQRILPNRKLAALLSLAAVIVVAGVTTALLLIDSSDSTERTSIAAATPAGSPTTDRKVVKVIWGDETVKWVRRGEAVPLPAAIPVSGPLLAKFEVTDGDESYLKWLDVYLCRMTAPDDALTGATVSAWSLMILMGHGGVNQAGEDLGTGHYRVPLQFTMPGAWQVDLTIKSEADQGTVSIEVPAWE